MLPGKSVRHTYLPMYLCLRDSETKLLDCVILWHRRQVRSAIELSGFCCFPYCCCRRYNSRWAWCLCDPIRFAFGRFAKKGSCGTRGLWWNKKFSKIPPQHPCGSSAHGMSTLLDRINQPMTLSPLIFFLLTVSTLFALLSFARSAF